MWALYFNFIYGSMINLINYETGPVIVYFCSLIIVGHCIHSRHESFHMAIKYVLVGFSPVMGSLPNLSFHVLGLWVILTSIFLILWLVLTPR
jgi:hypothetical protein